MEKSEQIDQLATSLSAAQGEFGPVPLNSVNPFLHTHYADLGSVIETAKEVLARHGLSVTQLVSNDGEMVGVTTVLLHASGQWISDKIVAPVESEKGKSRAQVIGSTITYFRRYAITSILGLYAGDDDDGSQGSGGNSESQPQRQQKTQVTKPQQQKSSVRMVTLSDGTTQKPAEEIIKIETVNALAKKYVGSGKSFAADAHLKNHLRKHFHVDKLSELTWEKMLALVAHLDGKSDDARWYSEEKKAEDPKASNTGYDEASLDGVVALWNEATENKLGATKWIELPDDKKVTVLELLNSGSVGIDDAFTVAGVLAAG